MGIVVELRVQGQDAERTEAELGGAGGQRAPRAVHIPAGGTQKGLGRAVGAGGKELQGQHSSWQGGRRRACVGAEGWSLAWQLPWEVLASCQDLQSPVQEALPLTGCRPTVFTWLPCHVKGQVGQQTLPVATL